MPPKPHFFFRSLLFAAAPLQRLQHLPHQASRPTTPGPHRRMGEQRAAQLRKTRGRKTRVLKRATLPRAQCVRLTANAFRVNDVNVSTAIANANRVSGAPVNPESIHAPMEMIAKARCASKGREMSPTALASAEAEAIAPECSLSAARSRLSGRFASAARSSASIRRTRVF